MSQSTVGAVGLDYVGLPLTAAFGSEFDTVGFDVSEDRIVELRPLQDSTGDAPDEVLRPEGSCRRPFVSRPGSSRTGNVWARRIAFIGQSRGRGDLEAVVRARFLLHFCAKCAEAAGAHGSQF